MITTQPQLTADAQTRNYRPGAIVILLTGAVVQITSWPWYEGEGDDRSARVMVRRYVGDPTTNHEIGYFEIMKHTGIDKPLDEWTFEPSSGARYSVVSKNDWSLTIRDEGPHDKHPTITNDAENVVQALVPLLEGRRLFYYDSHGELDELLIKDGTFAGFKPGLRNA
jgi:hypothetical protein